MLCCAVLCCAVLCCRLTEIKAKRDASAVAQALSALEAGARAALAPAAVKPEHNLLALSIAAARARATVGEISAVLEKVYGRYTPTNRVVSGAYKAEFQTKDAREVQAVMDATKAFEKKFGRRPRILVAKMVPYPPPYLC